MTQILRKSEVLILLVSVWVALTCNVGYWRVVTANQPAGGLPMPVYVGSVALLTIGLIYLVLSILAVGRLTRFVLVTTLIASAAAGCFTAKYGMLFDTGMLVNVLETNRSEALELASLSLAGIVIVFGLLPAIFVWRYPLPRRRFRTAVWQRSVAMVVALGLIGGPLFLNQKEIYSLARNHREIRHMIAPLNMISATFSYVQDQLESPEVFTPAALDAAHVRQTTQTDRPSVHVLIVGETARAANFSLGGYSRNTNPELQLRQDINFMEATSCGTATAVSLPCMFAIEGRAEFDRDVSANEDNLLDIAARAGYAVYWVDNGNGCKGICARVNSRDVHQSDVEPFCPSGECYDEILVHELSTLLSDVSQDTLIVLHQLGSHGPAYYRRYPKEFRVFLPDCRSPNLGDCSNAEIANSYDNTILYTDHIISRAIELLAAESDRMDSSLIYVSDHGESLGEHNLYLHGMPYRFAPDEQTHIPLITWTSAGVQQSNGLRANCVTQNHLASVSHDNLLHTELGLLEIRTAVYKPQLDIFSTCHEPGQLVVTNDSGATRAFDLAGSVTATGDQNQKYRSSFDSE